jgi:hypothetical protein
LREQANKVNLAGQKTATETEKRLSIISAASSVEAHEETVTIEEVTVSESVTPFYIPAYPSPVKPEDLPAYPSHVKQEDLPAYPRHVKPEDLPAYPCHVKPEDLPAYPSHVKPEDLPACPSHVKPDDLPAYPCHVDTVDLPAYPNQVYAENLPSISSHVNFEDLPANPSQLDAEDLPTYPSQTYSKDLPYSSSHANFEDLPANPSQVDAEDLPAYPSYVGSPGGLSADSSADLPAPPEEGHYLLINSPPKVNQLEVGTSTNNYFTLCKISINVYSFFHTFQDDISEQKPSSCSSEKSQDSQQLSYLETNLDLEASRGPTLSSFDDTARQETKIKNQFVTGDITLQPVEADRMRFDATKRPAASPMTPDTWSPAARSRPLEEAGRRSASGVTFNSGVLYITQDPGRNT